MGIVVNEGREHVFIVEDNEIYSMMLDYVLSKDSVFKFSSYKSGEECLQNLRQNPRVVILDYNLPGKNGLDVLKEIKQYNPGIHVLMLTNNQDMKLALRLLQEGADDYILKQGHGEKQIIEKVENLLAADQARQEELWRERNRTLYKKLAYGIAIASVLVAGILFFT
jgi:DNA-binding NarL/FixJ family response regulator